MLLPSSIQRAEDLVGMAMPTVPLLWANAPVTAVAVMAAASPRADTIVFRLLMLHSLDIEDSGSWIVGPLNAALETQSSRAAVRVLPPPSTRQPHVRFSAAARSDIEHEGPAMTGIGALGFLGHALPGRSDQQP